MLLKKQWPFQLYNCLWELHERLVSFVIVWSHLGLLNSEQRRDIMYLERNP